MNWAVVLRSALLCSGIWVSRPWQDLLGRSSAQSCRLWREDREEPQPSGHKGSGLAEGR